MILNDLDLQTMLIHFDSAEYETKAVVNPIYQTSNYRFDSPEHGFELFGEIAPPNLYTRYGSPNSKAVESLVNVLEGAEASLVLGSGMAAITTAILSNLEKGDHVVAQKTLYNATLTLINDIFPKYSIDVTQVKASETDSFAAAMRPNTRLVITETPANPTMELTDLAAVSEIAHQNGALVITDNTFASSFNQRPLELGCDVVVHSASKYLNGHSDVIAGVIAGKKDLIDRAWKFSKIYGAVLHPFEAWLLARGLRTYPLRMKSHNENAMTVARFLEKHPLVEKVHYPGLESHPQFDLATRQMKGGFGGMLSFLVKGGFVAAKDLVCWTRLCVSAISLGGPETLITHPASLVFGHFSEEQRQAIGIESNLIRLSIGLESAKDIIADLQQALDFTSN